MTRKRSVVFWIRTIHRWVSMAFVVLAVVVIFFAPVGTPAGDVLGVVAIALLLALIITAGWVAIHHYSVRFRRGRAPRRADIAA
ncbi:MAG: hypothetical protein QM755_04520 [Luteolibacter sp.]